MGIEEQARARLARTNSSKAQAGAEATAALARLEPELREFAAFMRSHHIPTRPIRVNFRAVKRGLLRRYETVSDHVGDGWRVRVIGEGSSQYIVTTDAKLFSFIETGRAVIPEPVAQLPPARARPPSSSGGDARTSAHRDVRELVVVAVANVSASSAQRRQRLGQGVCGTACVRPLAFRIAATV